MAPHDAATTTVEPAAADVAGGRVVVGAGTNASCSLVRPRQTKEEKKKKKKKDEWEIYTIPVDFSVWVKVYRSVSFGASMSV
jgi:hypothetical protein